MKKIFSLLLLVMLLAHSIPASAQWSPEKIRKKRTLAGRLNDSAWTYRDFFSNHSFMGEGKLSWRDFNDQLAASDEEVGALVKKYRSLKTIGYVVYVPAAVAITAGFLTNLSNWFDGAGPDGGETAVLLGGAGLLGSGILFLVANSHHRKAMQLFNLKARKKELGTGKVSFRLGLQRNGVGISFNW